MKTKILFFLVILLTLGASLRAQQVLSISPAGGVQASIDQNGWKNFKVTLTQNVLAFQFVGIPPPSQGTVTVIFTQNATGGFTATFVPWVAPSGQVINVSNACPGGLGAAAGVTTICQFDFDGTINTWVGMGGSGGTGGTPTPPNGSLQYDASGAFGASKFLYNPADISECNAACASLSTAVDSSIFLESTDATNDILLNVEGSANGGAFLQIDTSSTVNGVLTGLTSIAQVGGNVSRIGTGFPGSTGSIGISNYSAAGDLGGDLTTGQDIVGFWSVPLMVRPSGTNLHWSVGFVSGIPSNNAGGIPTEYTQNVYGLVVQDQHGLSTVDQAGILGLPQTAPGSGTHYFLEGLAGSGKSLLNDGIITNQADMPQIANPGSPATGFNRLYMDSTTHNLTCLTSVGGNCLTGAVTTWPNIAGGTNTGSAFLCGTGCSFGPTGGGTVTATSVPFTGVTGQIALAQTPLTTNGDVLTVVSGILSRLAQGANGTFLGVSGGALGYFTPSGTGTVTHTVGALGLNQVVIGNAGADINVAAADTNPLHVFKAAASGPPGFGAITSAMLPAINLAASGAGGVTGNLPTANLASGTGASASTFWRGDGTWATPTGSGTVNNSSQFSFPYYSGAGSTNTISGIAAPTGPNGVPQFEVSTPAGGLATAPTVVLPGILTRDVTGTTATDTIGSTDCSPQIVNYQGSVAVATSLPTATTLAVPNCAFKMVNNTSGSSTAVTVTATTWTFNTSGSSTLVIAQGQECNLAVDTTVATQWDADCHDQPLLAGTNVTITRNQFGVVVNSSAGGTPCNTTALSLQYDNAGVFGCVPDFTFSTPHTLLMGASGLLDLSAGATGSFKVPVAAGCTSAANGSTCYDTTNGNTHQRTNGADSLSAAEASAIVANTIPKATNSTQSLLTASSVVDNGTTVTSTDTGGYVGPVFTANGSTAGFVDYPQGTTSAAVAPCNTATSICEQAPTAVTSYLVVKPGVAAQGTLTNAVTSAVDTQGFSGDSNHSTVVTIGSGTSIGSTSLCSTTNCPVGTYRVNVYVDITTACGTSGTYVVNLIYTDDQGSKTVVADISGSGAVPATGVLTTTSTSNFGQVSQILRSTGSASINYSTTAVACGSAGPMVGKLYLSVEPVQ